MKQMSWLSGFFRDGQPALGGLRPDPRLRGVPDREQRVPELVGGEHGEYVGLVLAGIHRAAQHRAVLGLAQLRVVPGAHRVEAQRQRLVQQRGELDLLVAPQAGVRGAPRRIVRDELVDHFLGKPAGEVPHVERDAEHVGGT